VTSLPNHDLTIGICGVTVEVNYKNEGLCTVIRAFLSKPNLNIQAAMISLLCVHCHLRHFNFSIFTLKFKAITLCNELHELICFFCFQFEEKFRESPEDVEKLKNGKTKFLNIPHEVPSSRFPHQAMAACW
jgi:hypothetical protein